MKVAMMDFLIGDSVSHMESGISGEVVGFCPGPQWLRVKTGEGRKRIWLKENLKLESRPAEVAPEPEPAPKTAEEPLNPNAAPKGKFRVVGTIAETGRDFPLGDFSEARNAGECVLRNASDRIAAVAYDDEGEWLSRSGPDGYFGRHPNPETIASFKEIENGGGQLYEGPTEEVFAKILDEDETVTGTDVGKVKVP